jgi:putative flippase GtrA
VAPLLSGHRDVAIGSRLARGAHVVRGPKRELISRAYNLLLKVSVRGRFSDAQCGFKALRREAALQLLPLIKDDEWFFDTELLVTAQRLGLRISEVPVDWVDDPDSRVQILRTALNDLRGVWRISHGPARRLARQKAMSSLPLRNQVAADQLLRFAGVGAISTLGYLFLFIAWRPIVGTLGANALALAICTFFNTAVHRELSHNLHGSSHKGRLVGVAAGLLAISLGLTTLALLAAHALSADSLAVALAAVTLANAAASVLRFAVLRSWVFRPGPPTVPHRAEAS